MAQVAKSAAQQEHEQKLEDLRAVSATPGGRRFLRMLLDLTGYYGNTHADTDRHTAFLNGRRSVGIDLQVYLDEADPLIMLRLIQEAQETKNHERRKRSDRSHDDD